MSSLPIQKYQDEIIEKLHAHPRVLLNAPTGSGKSTGIPPFLYEQKAIKGRIIVVQPRRLAARLLAQRVAQTLGLTLGKEVGYSVRFDARYTKDTKILFLTDGVLTRQLAENPTLSGIGLIIFDEFHERRIATDIALGYCTDLQHSQRPDLKLLVMSATLAEEALETYLSPCAKVNAEGRSYPVDIQYRAPKAKIHPRTGRPDTPLIWDQIKALSRETVAQEGPGNWLIFLPGMHEIRKTIETLSHCSWLREYQIFPLYSSLPPKQQTEALEYEGPKIIVSTNVAETSLTINGIKTVIDSGLARESRYDASRDMSSLLMRKISRASATQRAGRAGRTAPGTCYRLWSRKEHESREDFQLPEALTVDLSPSLLLLASLGYHRERSFPWLDKPSQEALQRALDLLTSLGALDTEGRLTDTGSLISKLPLPPRLARLILAGGETESLPEALFVAAVLQGEPIVKRSTGITPVHSGRRRNNNPIADFEEKHDPSSFAGLYAVYQYAKANQFAPNALKPFGLTIRALRELDKSIQQLQNLLPKDAPRLHAEADFHSRAPHIASALLTTFPDRICLRLGAGTLSARLLGNRKGKLEDSTCARQGELFLATEIQEIEGRDVLTHLSGLIQLELSTLKNNYPDKLSTTSRVVLDDATNKIVTKEAYTYRHLEHELEISSKILNTPPDHTQAAHLLATMVIAGTLKLPKWDAKVEQWITRLNQLAQWMPELELPPITEADSAHLIEEICHGCTRTKEVKALDPWPTLQQWLSQIQFSALSSYAPTEITLSNGTKVKVTYEKGEPPFISVQLQRLYGVTSTPSLCNGSVPLKVHILAPNQRAWQITSDLPNFWENSYPQMKKDLAGRYPKHEWR